MNDLGYFILCTAGAFLLLVAEVFVPGGVLGALGGVSLIAACVFSFGAFGPSTGLLVSICLVVFTLLAVFMWIIKLPGTRVGKRIMLPNDLESAKSAADHDELIGASGVAETDLRPSGYARIGNKRYDVIAQRGYIEKDQSVEVVEVHGMRIVVSLTSGAASGE